MSLFVIQISFAIKNIEVCVTVFLAYWQELPWPKKDWIRGTRAIAENHWVCKTSSYILIINLNGIWVTFLQATTPYSQGTARQATLPCGIFGKVNWWQVTTSDYFSNFLSHLMTFHDHVTTFMTTGEDLWMTLGTLCDDMLMALVTIVKTCWQPWWQWVTTGWWPLMMTLMTLLMTLMTYVEA